VLSSFTINGCGAPASFGCVRPAPNINGLTERVRSVSMSRFSPPEASKVEQKRNSCWCCFPSFWNKAKPEVSESKSPVGVSSFSAVEENAWKMYNIKKNTILWHKFIEFSEEVKVEEYYQYYLECEYLDYLFQQGHDEVFERKLNDVLRAYFSIGWQSIGKLNISATMQKRVQEAVQEFNPEAVLDLFFEILTDIENSLHWQQRLADFRSYLQSQSEF